MILSRVKSKICFLIVPWGRWMYYLGNNSSGDTGRVGFAIRTTIGNIKARFMAFFFMTLIKTFSLTTRRRDFLLFSLAYLLAKISPSGLSFLNFWNDWRNEKRAEGKFSDTKSRLLLAAPYTTLVSNPPLLCAALKALVRILKVGTTSDKVFGKNIQKKAPPLFNKLSKSRGNTPNLYCGPWPCSCCCFCRYIDSDSRTYIIHNRES